MEVVHYADSHVQDRMYDQYPDLAASGATVNSSGTVMSDGSKNMYYAPVGCVNAFVYAGGRMIIVTVKMKD